MKRKLLGKLRLTAVAVAASLALCARGGSGGAKAPKPEGEDKAVQESASSSAEDGTLRIAMNSDINTMDVHQTTMYYLVPMNVFDTLFTIKKNEDGSTSIENSLATDYKVSDDGLTYDFTLRDDVVFSDGTPLTADDVKFTFERILTLPDSQQVDYAISIAGAQELLDGKATELSGITVTDDTHFSITLSEPFAGFLAQLATPSTSIYSRSIVTEAGDQFGADPSKTLGTGPYKITKWEKGSGLTFDYNPKYWGEEPSVKHVTAQVMDASSMDMAFQKGDLDILDCLLMDSAIVESTYKTKFADNIISVDRLGTNFFMMNEKMKPLDDVKVRKAVQMAIDRQSILDSIYSGDGKLEDGIYPTGCLGYSEANQGWLKYDPEGAKKLLSEAGYADGFDIEIALNSTVAEASRNAVQIIAKNLQDVGINATVKSYDDAGYMELRNKGDAPMYLALWLLDFNDPDNIIYTFFGSKENTVLRSDNYPDEATIKRIADARAIVNTDTRMKEYADLEKKLVRDDAVWVPLYSLKHLFVKSDRVAEFTPQWAGWSDIYFTGVTLN